MSLRERESSLTSLQSGITRSQSFGSSSLTPNSSRKSLKSGDSLLRHGWADMGVLGQGSIRRDVRRSGSLLPHVKIPKSPRTQRTVLIASAAAKGVQSCSSVTREHIFSLTNCQQDFKKVKQIKALERYLARLEYLLSQLEYLQEQYSLHQRLRDGAKTMAYAYSLSPGKDKSSALNNVKSGFRECTEKLCFVEVQIEQIIGTFTMQIQGNTLLTPFGDRNEALSEKKNVLELVYIKIYNICIQGFARLCSGDVFEVCMKHGTQKWKSRGKVAKDKSQAWDNQTHTFKALIGEMLVVKACEVRLLSKTAMLTNKMCETKGFFSPHPQVMTINLNPTGSLKLTVVVTWNALDYQGFEDETLSRGSSMCDPSPNFARKSANHSISSGTSWLEMDRESSLGSISANSWNASTASPISDVTKGDSDSYNSFMRNLPNFNQSDDLKNSQISIQGSFKSNENSSQNSVKNKSSTSENSVKNRNSTSENSVQNGNSQNCVANNLNNENTTTGIKDKEISNQVLTTNMTDLESTNQIISQNNTLDFEKTDESHYQNTQFITANSRTQGSFQESCLKQAVSDLKQSDSNANQLLSNLKQPDLDLKQSNSDFNDLNSNSKQSNTDLKPSNPNFKQTDSDLKQSNPNLKQTYSDLKQTDSDLKQLDSVLKQSDSQQNTVDYSGGKSLNLNKVRDVTEISIDAKLKYENLEKLDKPKKVDSPSKNKKKEKSPKKSKSRVCELGEFTLVRKPESRGEQWARYSHYFPDAVFSPIPSSDEFRSTPQLCSLENVESSEKSFETQNVELEKSENVGFENFESKIFGSNHSKEISMEKSECSDITTKIFENNNLKKNKQEKQIELRRNKREKPENNVNKSERDLTKKETYENLPSSYIYSYENYDANHRSYEDKWCDVYAWDSAVPSTLPKVVLRLKCCLEDIQGQFPELHLLEESVLELLDICKNFDTESLCESETSEISASVESALECFDFLNAQSDDEFGDIIEESSPILSPSSLVKDSPITVVSNSSVKESSPIIDVINGPTYSSGDLAKQNSSIIVNPDSIVGVDPPVVSTSIKLTSSNGKNISSESGFICTEESNQRIKDSLLKDKGGPAINAENDRSYSLKEGSQTVAMNSENDVNISMEDRGMSCSPIQNINLKLDINDVNNSNAVVTALSSKIKDSTLGDVDLLHGNIDSLHGNVGSPYGNLNSPRGKNFVEVQDYKKDDLNQLTCSKSNLEKDDCQNEDFDASEALQKTVTGNAQLDAFLLIHLQHCLRLMHNLGSYGPLRLKEQNSLTKFKIEGRLFKSILTHKHDFDSLRPQHIMSVPRVQVLWDSVTSSEDWCVTGAEVVEGLTPIVSNLLESKNKKVIRSVLEELVCEMTDSEIYSSCLTVTAGHFLSHLLRPLQEIIPEIFDNLNCCKLLSQFDPISVDQGLIVLRKITLTSTKLIAQHFLGPKQFSSLIQSFVVKHRKEENIIIPLFNNCLLLLEGKNRQIRSYACTLLGFIFKALDPDVDIRKIKNSSSESMESFNEDEVDKFEEEEYLNGETINSKVETKYSGDGSQLNSDSNLQADIMQESAITVSDLGKNIDTEANVLKKANVETYLAEDTKVETSFYLPTNDLSNNATTEKGKLSKNATRKSMQENCVQIDGNQVLSVLSFLQQNDSSQQVRNSAKLALLSLGAVGQEALQQVQLSSHGFQGIAPKPYS